jgi:hypothetical protein
VLFCEPFSGSKSFVAARYDSVPGSWLRFNGGGPNDAYARITGSGGGFCNINIVFFKKF